MKIAFVHYNIGDRDGVNNVMRTNALTFLKRYKNSKVYFIGSVTRPLIEDYLTRVKYIDIPDLDVLTKKRKTYFSRLDVFSYIREGIDIFNKIDKALNGMDLVFIENPNLGIHPAATYAYYRFVKRNFQRKYKRKIIYRIHDFAEDRRGNFINILKFKGTETSPYWHKIVFPTVGNLSYVVVNQKDLIKLHSHGIIQEDKSWYVPNPLNEDLLYKDTDVSMQLRQFLIRKYRLNKNVKFIYYPVRIVPRKNVEEAIFLTQLINYKFGDNYVLVLSLKGHGPTSLKYYNTLNHYIKKHRLPVILGISDYVTFKRTYTKSGKIKTFGVGDMYSICDKVITTSLLEGFGLFFIESWFFNKSIIGRDLPDITPDFKNIGLNLEHLYTSIFIKGEAIKRFSCSKKLNLIHRLRNEKFRKRFYEENKHTLEGLFDVFDPGAEKKLIKENRKIVMTNFLPTKVILKLMEVYHKTTYEPIIERRLM